MNSPSCLSAPLPVVDYQEPTALGSPLIERGVLSDLIRDGAADNSSEQRSGGDDEVESVAVPGRARCLPADRGVPGSGQRPGHVASPDARGTIPAHRWPGGDGGLSSGG